MSEEHDHTTENDDRVICKVCGEPITPLPRATKPRKVHVWCGDRTNVHAGLKKIREQLGEDAYKEAAAKAGIAYAPRKEGEIAKLDEADAIPELIAVGLSIHPDNPQKAARAVGLLLSDAEAMHYAEEARKHHLQIIEMRASAASKIAHQATMLLALNLRSNALRMPPAQIGGALKSIQMILEYFSGGLQHVYNDIQLVVQAPDGSAWQMTHKGLVAQTRGGA